MPGARRPHRKTRNGCLACKARRIKCDEVKPSCGTCIRYLSPCTYPTGTSTTPHISHPASGNPGGLLATSRSSLSTQSTPQPSYPISSTAFNIKHLELLHFYTTTTCFTFTTLPARAQIYQHIVPQIAFHHDFLLGGILALSALHLSQLQPQRKESLHRDATLYHDPALASFKVAMTDITPQNCDAVYVFSTFLVAYAWTSSDGTGNLFFVDPHPEVGGGESTAEWVRLLRGCRTLLRNCFDWVMAGHSRAFLVLYNEQPEIFDLSVEDEAKFDALERLWGPQSTFTPAEVDSLSESLRHLKEAYAMLLAYTPTSTKLCTIGLTIAWSIRCPDTYIALVNQRRPEALILLAHYCLLLNKVDNVWWLRGISRHLLKSIHRTIGSEWESWIAWPLQELVLMEFRGGGEERKYGLMREENQLRVHANS